MVALNKDVDISDEFFPTDSPGSGGSSNSQSSSPQQSIEVAFVKDLVDTLQVPPPSVTVDYLSIVTRAAASVGQIVDASYRVTGARTAWEEKLYPEQSSDGYYSKSVTKPEDYGTGPGASEKMRNAANIARNAVFAAVNAVSSFIFRARSAGFSPAPNPFIEMSHLNDQRIAFNPISISQEDAVRLVSAVREYLSLLEAEARGDFDLSTGKVNVSQVVSATLSLDGFGGSGDTLVDLARLLPDADSVKAQKASEALSFFDFTKRVPKVVFTAEYSPSGTPMGVLVGWKKVPDAAGYIVRRRNVFTGEEVKILVTNDQVSTMTSRFSDYVRSWITSFYDTITPEKIFVFLDNKVVSDTYYVYNVTAYQLQNTSKHAIFSTQTSPAFLTVNQKRQITDELKKLDPENDGKAISPYPVIAHVVMGDAKYDWILAAVNTRSSIDRGDSRVSTRSYSYLASQIDFLFAQSDAGRLLVPKNNDTKQIFDNIQTAISKYGVNQVIKDVLSETGCLYYFDGKDSQDSIFSNVGADEESQLVSVVAAAIDPETATLDLKSLASNLPALISGEAKFRSGDKKSASPKEIEMSDATNEEISGDEIQFLSKLGDTSTIVDLTTPEGVGVFVRTVRIFSDIGPNGGRPIVSTPPTITPDPVRPPPPAPPPKRTTTQPVQEPINETATTATDKKSEASANDVKKIKAEVKNNPSGKGKGDV